MRVPSFLIPVLAAVLTLAAPPAGAQERGLIPERRLSIAEGMDLSGSDLAQIFDTTLEGCEAACLARADCEAVTFNARNNSCFPKAGISGMTPYQGAFSGVVVASPAAAETRAKTRAADLGFLWDGSLDAALDQARGMARAHLTNFARPEDLTQALSAARAQGDVTREIAIEGALIVLTDASDLWSDYALLQLRRPQGADSGAAVTAAVNSYLRAANAAQQAEALSTLAQALEADGRTREMVAALRLAASFSPRQDIAAALDDAVAKYGFRITEHQVEADSAAPRICAVFSDDLARSGVDYASFVQLPKAGLSVEAEANQLCVAGLAHGERYALTFRKGLPSATKETLSKDVTITAYVRDRGPAVTFPGRAYILPKGEDSGLPVQTVNTEHLDLKLLRVSDRNLVASMQRDYFARSLDQWDAGNLEDSLAQTVWTGTADVGMEVNRDVTTRLPVQEVTGPLGPGVYVLSASIPGADPYEHPPATQWFVISDLGLTSFSGTDGLTVAVRGLSDAKAVAGATVTLVSRANAVIGSATTDAEGVAHFDPALAAGAGNAAPALVSVTQGEDMAFLSLTDAEFDLSDRGVEGMPPAPPIDVFLATDRGAYRTGETVQATMLARDATAAALPGVPLTAVLMRPDGVEYSRSLAQDAGDGGATAALPIGAQAPRGTWRLDVFADPKAAPLATTKFLVEDFLPERIDFALTLPEGILAGGDLPAIGIAARYLFGAPGGGLGFEGDLRLAAADSLPGFDGYRFGRYDTPFEPRYDSLEAGETDAEGAGEIQAALPDLGTEAARPLEARFTVRLREGSGRPVERSISRLVMPSLPVIGIRPGFDGAVAEGAEARFRLIALGPDAKPVALPLHWTLNRVETRYQWYAMDGQWNWEPITHRTRVAEGDASPGTTPAEIAAKTDWGEYELVVEAGHGDSYTSASMRFDAGWYAPADVMASPDRLELALDKPAYATGDTARLRLVAPAPGVALVSVLSNRLIALKSVPVKAGENRIELPVTDDWGAGAYVTASVIRPLAEDAPARAPMRAMGLSYAQVDPGPRALKASFDVPAASDPRAPLPVALKVEGAQPGETVHATIAAVDLGILNLTGFKAPDPQAHYFGQRRLGVGLRDVYGRLIDGRAGTEGVLRSGGDAGREMSLQAPPPTEELVAYFSGPLTVGEDGMIRTSFDMPAFNGTVRLSAIAWSKTGVGQASADVLVRDPVVVTASLPRFLAPGDHSRLLLEIVHATGPSGRMGLDVSAAGVTLGERPSGVDLGDLGKAEVEIPLTAPAAEGVQQIRIALTTPDGKLLEKVVTVPVERNDPQVAHESRFELAAGKTFTFDANVFAGMVPGTARATLAAGPIARFNTPALLAALDAYPYGCTEQITSKAMPLLYLSTVAEKMRLVTPADLGDRIDTAIRKVLTNQDASGAFGLWSPESGDGWLDAYVTDFLSRAKAAGHAVPDTAFRNALDNLRNQVNYAADFDSGSNGGGQVLAYALMVLAREGAAAVGDLRYYADVKGDDFATPLAAAQLGAALASYGDQGRADAMFARAGRMLSAKGAETGWRDDYGTGLRDTAAVLALAAQAGSNAVNLESTGKALASRLAAVPLSTQEAAWTLMAASALIDRPDAGGLTVDGAPVKGPLVEVIDAETAGRAVAIANPGDKAQTLTLTTFGVPEVPEPAGGKGWSISRSWYTLEGDPADPATVKQGTRLVAVLEIAPLGQQDARLMVDDPLPAGFEIDNPNLIRGGDIAALDWLDVAEDTRMTEFRQDRFLAAIDAHGDRPFRLAYIVRAVSPGRFHLPAASVADMYRPEMRAQSDAGEVVIE
ncbi:alpha-2-macroglobulin family protein [Sinirhodobacter ferrireducens]|uniref:Alpha-2-macroglobulin family protein n=1 Tax=Paenirhodobacter ferrireducens TaxID=1215032 RepID=A0A443L654_9RHOB|nr:alpha-2-macroglobulin family protein [Sinirhodobacter ferrireducens]RWR44644.1 alpha-2-macroglobulin family protein [Sinirhodobacter ferrireducens]